MINPFLRFEDGKITLNGKDLLVQSANLSIAPSLSVSRVYGDYNEAIQGASTEFINFTPNSNLKGQLSISFFISNDIMSPNNVNRLFELAEIADPSVSKTKISEEPINNNIVGRYRFDNMFLTSFGFEMTPFSLVRANANYDIYGTINKETGRYFQKTDVDFAHSLKSFGNIKVSKIDAEDPFEITSLRYNISVQRKIHNRIRENESTIINTYAGGAAPSRVSVENVESEVNIECDQIPENLNSYGDQQYGSSPEQIANTQMDVFLYSLLGQRVSRFRCSGKIQSQSYSINEGSAARGSITIKQIIL